MPFSRAKRVRLTLHSVIFGSVHFLRLLWLPITLLCRKKKLLIRVMLKENTYIGLRFNGHDKTVLTEFGIVNF